MEIQMRRSTDLNGVSISKSTESKVLEQSSSAAPEGAGEGQPPNSECDRSAPDEDREPEPSPEGPGWGERSWPDAEQSLLERLPPMPGCPAWGGGIALAPTSASEDADEEEADAQAERTEWAGEGDRPLPRFIPERDLSLLDKRLRRFSERGDSLARSCQATTSRAVYTVRWLRKEWQLSLLCWGWGGGGVPPHPPPS